ncbi:MAG TPA: acyl-CoA dehydrogenase family protein [Candidatus Binataceae bacterium]|nr:acyl-CoA dehydrogenase family protein [Candidatus Binataceae bacterium]
MVDFELSEEQQMMRDTVGSFARDEIRPAARLADEDCAVPQELLRKAWQLGLVRGAIPEQFGGDGAERSAVTGAVVAEELGYGDVSIALHMLAPRLLAFPVLEMGTDAQKAQLLKSFVAADFVAATAAVVEPSWDFDLSSLTSHAVSRGGGFVLNGSKCLVPLADQSDTILVYASRQGQSGFEAVDGFLVPRAAAGVTVGEREKNMGLRPLATYELTFTDCAVGVDARLGGEKGINFSRLMSETRVALGALGVGMMRAAFDYARDYARERKAFGVPIATKQAVAFMLADMAIEIDAARLLVWEAASRLDKAEDALKESYLAKNYVAASALKVTDNAVQTLGGHGYIREHPVEMWLRNARGLATLDGIATV